MIDELHGHKLTQKMVTTPVGDRDVPEDWVRMPLYKCVNCGWEGFVPKLFGCPNPDISELTDLLK